MKPRTNTVLRLLHSRAHAAASLDISIRAIDYLIASRELATRTIGSRRLIPDSELIRYSNRNHPGPIVLPKSRRGSESSSQHKRKGVVPEGLESRDEEEGARGE